MSYEYFLDNLIILLSKKLPTNYQITSETIMKNNGIFRDAIIIRPPERTITPTIYLESHYQNYKNGTSLDCIVDEILYFYTLNSKPPQSVFEHFHDFEFAKEYITFKIVHLDMNRDFLKHTAHIPFLDLAIVFCLLIRTTTSELSTAIINNALLEKWDTTTSELYDIAFLNTPQKYPFSIRPLEDVLSEHFDDCLVDAPRLSNQLFLFTNSIQFLGAHVLLYEELLFDFAYKQNCDFYILPSSIHEVLLVPVSYFQEMERLKDMVISINQTDLSQDEILSNSIYLYSLEKRSISLVA